MKKPCGVVHRYYYMVTTRWLGIGRKKYACQCVHCEWRTESFDTKKEALAVYLLVHDKNDSEKVKEFLETYDFS